MNDEINRTLHIHRFYVKDCSVESPNTPEVFKLSGETNFKIDLALEQNKLEDNNYEIVLSVRTTATMAERTLFLVEVKHAALIQAFGFPEEELKSVLEIWAPNQIYPFAREVITSLSAQAGFPPLILPVINLEQYFENRRQQEAAAQAAPAPSVQ